MSAFEVVVVVGVGLRFLWNFAGALLDWADYLRVRERVGVDR